MGAGSEQIQDRDGRCFPSRASISAISRRTSVRRTILNIGSDHILLHPSLPNEPPLATGCSPLSITRFSDLVGSADSGDDTGNRSDKDTRRNG